MLNFQSGNLLTMCQAGKELPMKLHAKLFMYPHFKRHCLKFKIHNFLRDYNQSSLYIIIPFQIASLKEDIKILKSDRAKYMKEAHEVAVKYNKEKLEKTTVTNNLKQQTAESLQQHMLREDKIKLAYDRETNSLQRKLAETQAELEKERKEHSRTKRGLEHLRTHFASLPFTGEGEMVVEDQLKSWTY